MTTDQTGKAQAGAHPGRQAGSRSGADLDGRIALVTGGGTGIGLATTRQLLAAGSRVMIAGRNQARLDAVAAGLCAEFGADRCRATPADVSVVADVEALVARTEAAWQGLDIVIANAGIGLPTTLIVDLPVEDFDRVIATNLRGVFLCLKFGIPALRRRGGGAVVVVSSIAGLKARGTGNSAYVASKHGELGLVKTAAHEYAADGIRINAVLPGPTDTEMIRELAVSRAQDSGGDGKAEILRNMPQKRYASPDEVARLIAFLASAEASFCTGGIYTADGGLSAG